MNDRNSQYNEWAHRFIPGGAHTYSRGDDQYPANAPKVLASGKGAYVTDADGKTYLDFGMALRAVTIGYADPRVNQAAVYEIEQGNNLTRPSMTEILAAKELCELIPGADMVKFGKNGSNVTTAAVKLARAYTGRTIIARCAQHPFFSFDDWYIGDTVMDSGIPQEIKSLTDNFNFNDLPSLEALFDRHPGQVACVILEPATTVEPAPGFLQGVKELCAKQGAVFILDEMITGFRWHLQGAQAYYGVTADLCTFGKGMANGFSVSALAGKREIMRLGGISGDHARVFLVSTTHGGEMCGLGAFRECMRLYRELGVVEQIWKSGKALVDGFNALAAERGIQGCFTVEGLPCSPNYMTRDLNGNVSLGLRTLFHQEMLASGVLIPWIALSYSHQDAEISRALEAAAKALDVYVQALDQGVEKYLIGNPIKPVFRKFNEQ